MPLKRTRSSNSSIEKLIANIDLAINNYVQRQQASKKVPEYVASGIIGFKRKNIKIPSRVRESFEQLERELKAIPSEKYHDTHYCHQEIRENINMAFNSIPWLLDTTALVALRQDLDAMIEPATKRATI